MNSELEIIWKLAAALGIGLLIGIERGWHGREEDEGDRVAGIRTFSLVGLLGGITTTLIPHTGEWILGLAFLSLTALLVTSYIFELKIRDNEDIGITTEIALLLTFSLAAWAAMGYQLEALGCAVAVITILSLKPVLHQWLKKIEVEEIYAGIKLLVISVILLPLLPNQGYGPWESLNPYWIWWMVVLISGLSFIGYILLKYLDESWGTLLTSIIGGLASSTAVTISLADFAKQQKKTTIQIFIAGVLVASSIMFIRVIIEVSIVNSSLLYPLWVPIAVMLVLSLICVLWLWNQSAENDSDMKPTIELKNPLQLPTALKFGALLALILLLSTALEKWFGNRGIYLLALFSGLMDVDAITLSISQMAKQNLNSSVAVMGILLAVISNTLVKAGLFMFMAGVKKSRQLLWMILIICAGGILSMLFI
ncbi:MAG: MgtC/SapB family protein [Balneolaceae bacterium]|nr:MgtC/SapB family protein [Balneolaceae bacterium]